MFCATVPLSCYNCPSPSGCISNTAFITSLPAPLSSPSSPLPASTSSPSLPPSGQHELFYLPEGLLSNTRLPRHSGPMWVYVCVSGVLHKPAWHTAESLGFDSFTRLCLLGKHTREWDRGHRSGFIGECSNVYVSTGELNTALSLTKFSRKNKCTSEKYNLC